MFRTRIVCIGCAVVAGILLTGCGAGPAPIKIYEDDRNVIALQFDSMAGTGHSHPVSLEPGHIATILSGVRLQGRDVIGGFGAFAGKETSPAFTPAESVLLASALSQALKKASPKDLATFYLATLVPGKGVLITSGGVFVRSSHLYLILANARTSPLSVQYENTFTPDMRDSPLMAIARFKFSVSFSPQEALIANSQAKEQDGYEGYVDESKMVVIDLKRLLSGQ